MKKEAMQLCITMFKGSSAMIDLTWQIKLSQRYNSLDNRFLRWLEVLIT